jgi:hypothetical protein
VGHRRLAAVGTRHQIGCGHLVVVGSAHIALRAASASLRDGHGLLLLSVGLLLEPQERQ